MKTTLCLVRHGETDWNVARRLQGHLDIPLNAIGLQQAAAAACGLISHGFHAIYSSDLLRARQTAQAAAQGLGLSIIEWPALRERHFGLFQGLTAAEAEARFPDAYANYISRQCDYIPPDGGESLAGFASRVHGALMQIVAAHPGQAVLVVTHGGVLHMANRMVTGVPIDEPRDYPIPNAALNWLSYRDGQWRIDHWADQRHLQGALDEI
ncbi:putative phosphoglycerate mutase [Chitinivorax tropicus]|uniref:Putative phosphoglycerate mutase n=1 Tax=Chitinivorax tropicus TaxID=714531 RepID=A0A840MPE9_9PROT|nr:histidine phosphatase family protein [Chitinivorax tropicus]MBB5018053.1 putative phosphoglycerate mutase [Chitinivorax tropicus]